MASTDEWHQHLTSNCGSNAHPHIRRISNLSNYHRVAGNGNSYQLGDQKASPLRVYKMYVLPSWSSPSLFQDQVNVKTKKDGSPLFLRPILVTSHTFNLDNSGLALPFHTCIYILEAINYHTNTRGSKGLGTRLSSHRLVVWSNFSQTDIVPAPMGSL